MSGFCPKCGRAGPGLYCRTCGLLYDDVPPPTADEAPILGDVEVVESNHQPDKMEFGNYPKEVLSEEWLWRIRYAPVCCWCEECFNATVREMKESFRNCGWLP